MQRIRQLRKPLGSGRTRLQQLRKLSGRKRSRLRSSGCRQSAVRIQKPPFSPAVIRASLTGYWAAQFRPQFRRTWRVLLGQHGDHRGMPLWQHGELAEPDWLRTRFFLMFRVAEDLIRDQNHAVGPCITRRQICLR
jgi:hypothetical protein